MEGRKVILFLVAAVLMVAAGCTRRDKVLDARVDAVSALAEVCPDSALRLLDSMAPVAAGAPEASRMRHALATVKARDKAYIRPASDSLILPVIKYYADRPASDSMRPMAFYYAGRVYSDLGDAPKALDYFGQALKAIPDSQNPRLRSTIHAQRGEIYYLAGFLDEALMENKKTLYASTMLNDSLLIIDDLISLGYGYHAAELYDSALIYYRKAYDMAVLKDVDSKKSTALSKIALVHHQRGEVFLADSLIHEALEYPVSSQSKSPLYSIASDIINDYDSPLYQQLMKWRCDSGSVYGKHNANLNMALLDISRNNLDSARFHIARTKVYYDSIRSFKSTEAIAHMKAMYDYSIHEKENSLLKAERTALKWQLAVGVITLVMIVIVASWYIVRLRSQNRKFRELEQLYINKEKDTATTVISEEDISALPIVKTFKEKSESGDSVSEEEWHELNAMIKTHYPNLYLVLKVNNVLSLVEWRVTILTKIGIPPSKVGILINRSKNSVSSIRTRLNKKLNGGSGSSKDWDAFVRLL